MRGREKEYITQQNIQELSFEDSEFDIVFSRDVFFENMYHQQQAKMVAEIDRVLNHNGLYICQEGMLAFNNVISPNIERVVNVYLEK